MPLAEKKKLRQVLSVYPTVSSYTPHFYFPHPLSFSLLFLNDFYINKLTHIVTHASFPFSISTSHHLYDHTTNDIATPLISTTTCSLVGYLPELTNLCDSVLQFNQFSVHTMLSSVHSLPAFSLFVVWVLGNWNGEWKRVAVHFNKGGEKVCEVKLWDVNSNC